MSYKEKVEYVAIMRRKYAGMSTKLAKGRVLDEFCEMTELDRKHAIKKLNKRAGRFTESLSTGFHKEMG